MLLLIRDVILPKCTVGCRMTAMAIISFLAATVTAAAGQKQVLLWNPSPGIGVAGYRVYSADLVTRTTNQIDVGNATSCTLSNLIEGRTYSFFVTAYAATGLESDPSNTLEVTTPLGPIDTTFSASPNGVIMMTLRARGNEGVRVALQTSTNLADWVTLVPAGAPGESIDYTVTVPADDAKRFFRSHVVE